jgi:hypothetical protein
VIKREKTFAPGIPIRNADEETLALSTSRKFLKLSIAPEAGQQKRAPFPPASYGGV